MRSPGGKDKNRTYNSNYIPKEAEYLGGGWAKTLAGEGSDPRPKICDMAKQPPFLLDQNRCFPVLSFFPLGPTNTPIPKLRSKDAT